VIDPYEAAVDLGQAKFKILKGTTWSAMVRLRGCKNWTPYPINVEKNGQAQVLLDPKDAIRIRVRDLKGLGIGEARIQLIHSSGELLSATTDEQGNAQVLAPRGEIFRTRIEAKGRSSTTWRQDELQVRTEPYDFTLARNSWLSFWLEGTNFQAPGEAVIVSYGDMHSEFIGIHVWSAWDKWPPMSNDAVKRIVVIAPGCAPAAKDIEPPTMDSFRSSQAGVKVHRGPTIVVPRAVLTHSIAEPIRATATAIHIAESHLGEFGKDSYITEKFSSEFTPTEGDIVFGPFAPGTYALKILDASGKMLWEETRLVQ
jgi:hypothetical protein